MGAFYINHYESPLGGITLGSDGEALTGLWFDRQKNYPYISSVLYEPLHVFAETRRWLDIYFDGKDPGFTPQLHMNASPFRLAVWEILKTIPYGKTLTYGGIAARLSQQKRMSAQAVGGAVGHNPISLIVPCHRVVGAGGKLVGYAGGIERKASLLRLEGVKVL